LSTAPAATKPVKPERIPFWEKERGDGPITRTYQLRSRPHHPTEQFRTISGVQEAIACLRNDMYYDSSVVESAVEQQARYRASLRYVWALRDREYELQTNPTAYLPPDDMHDPELPGVNRRAGRLGDGNRWVSVRRPGKC
jgi:hypothetical protein